MTDSTDIVDRLAQHKILGAPPREELAWLATHGTLRKLATGDQLSSKGAPVLNMYVMFSGRYALFIDRGAGPQKLLEWGGHDVTGALPFSRLASAPGNSFALEPGEVLCVPRQSFPDLTRECP